MNTNIVCLGWGSLIWDSRELSIPPESWRQDGPPVPIEFVRFSNNGRVTLVVDPSSTPVRVLWARMNETSLEDAIEVLRKREGTSRKHIHSLTINAAPADKVQNAILEWMHAKGVSAVIWTGLPGAESRPSVQDVVSYIRSETNTAKLSIIEEYVRKAPKQIDTEYRKVLAQEFGWHAL